KRRNLTFSSHSDFVICDARRSYCHTGWPEGRSRRGRCETTFAGGKYSFRLSFLETRDVRMATHNGIRTIAPSSTATSPFSHRRARFFSESPLPRSDDPRPKNLRPRRHLIN